jgi:hypothetical protein
MNEEGSLTDRWSAYRPSKGAYFWSCVTCVAATIVIGFTWGGWVTGATVADRTKQAVRAAEAQLAANLCVGRFEKSADAATELAALKSTEYWQRDEFVTKGPWLKLPGVDQPIPGAANLCVERLLSATLLPAKPPATLNGGSG